MQSFPENLSQMLPTEQHSNVFQPPLPSQPLFRPYDHYPTPSTRGFNRLNTQLRRSRQSAFKPVVKRSTKTISEPKLRACTAVPCFCHLSGVLNPTLAMRNQHSSGTLLRESYDSLLVGGSDPSHYDPATQSSFRNISTSCNSATNQPQEKMNEEQIPHRTVTQYQQTAQGNVVVMLCPDGFHLLIVVFFTKQINPKKIFTNWI